MLPIFIVENGVADKSDRYRAPFVVAHLQQVKRAIDNGANVIGYLHWSFMSGLKGIDPRPNSVYLILITLKTKVSRTLTA